MEIVSAKFPFDVIVNDDNWKAQSEDIQAVLLSVADVFIRHFPENQFPAVTVSYTHLTLPTKRIV